MEPKLQKSLEKARNDLYDENIVAFLGEEDSGKTVVSALLKHALFNHFIPNSNGKYEGIVSGGQDIINQTLGDMIKEGEFPQKTKPIERRVISVDIFTTKGKGPGKVELILRDMSGEDFTDYLTREYSNPEKRLHDILMANKNDGEEYGPLAHLVFAKMYAILIDCEKYDFWEHEQSYAAVAVTALRKIKELAKDTQNKRIYHPLAIIFTKTDKLDPKIKSLPAEKLMKKMPEFVTALNTCYNGPKNYFKMSVDVIKESQKDVNARIARAKEKARDAYDQKEIERETNIQNELNQIFKEKHQQALNEKKTEEQANEEANAVKDENAPIVEAKYPKIEFTFDKSESSESYDKIKLPLKYSSSEYIRFISWILQNFTR